MASFNKLKVVVTVAGGLLIFALLCYLPLTVITDCGKETRGMKVGSRPPRCEGKCLNCRPCIATLIAPIHQGKLTISANSKEDDTYYLLAWRCKCANKLFQP
ncbi:hypothetical protein K7X08_016691 [Anisodus acutangulus]|uniref:Epidermal patterning factor-like protein n=1 Tax=Anisodus acutangulus TaxID=402998 RepID=A0A9Q1R0R7_9SOLA|nr:hypothetical protein K7X08_016691 [Anisodus acutangulus]